jgi:hypothetical protein
VLPPAPPFTGGVGLRPPPEPEHATIDVARMNAETSPDVRSVIGTSGR